jgi:hypothetical protein
MDEGVKALLSHTIRDAIYDIRPHPDKARVKPYMYWSPKKTKSCVKMLLKRAPALQVLADKYPKGTFARMYADYVRQNSNNERSMQKRQLRLIFTDPDSDFSMIRISSAQGADPDITISTALSMDFAAYKNYAMPSLVEACTPIQHCSTSSVRASKVVASGLPKN